MFKPREYQKQGVEEILDKFKNNRSVLYTMPTGAGKCLAKNTNVIMFDGSVKKVQDIDVGEFIMGDDSTKRKILSLARGKEEMFKITPTKGESYTVNRSHILSLKVTGVKTSFRYKGVKYKGGDVFNISVNDYINLTNHQKHLLKGYRVPLYFDEKEIYIDPYYLGLWLGDGSSSRTMITTGDKEIENYILELANKEDLTVSYYKEKGNCDSISIHSNWKRDNSFVNKFKELGVFNNKHIPNSYKINSKETRLSVLAGLLDSDGHLHQNGFDVVLKSEKLMDDLIFLARSLGFSAYKSKCIKTIKSINFSGEYFRTCINGDFSEVPFKLNRHKGIERKQIKNVLNYGFKIESLGIGDYYGFTIDGNHLFCLGDFTVTHNTFAFTMLAKYFTHTLKQKVLVLCHRKELVEQTIDSFARVGVTSEAITPKVRKAKHKSDAYVAMIETANNRLKTDPNFFKDVGLVICDECHILIFNKVFSYFPNSKILGCTATPVLTQRETYFKCGYCNRESNVVGECCGYENMEWSRPLTMSNFYDTIVVGPSIKYLIDNGYLVPEVSYIKQYIDESTLKVDSSGDYSTKSQEEAYGNEDVMFNVVLNYKELCFGKKTMIFTASTKTNILLLEEFQKNGIENVRSFDSVHQKASERKELVDWFKGSTDGILINTGVFTTGFDDTTVQAIIMARSTLSLSLYLQIVGRGGRVTDKIFKDSFIFIDGGNNIERHLEWSDDSRDWEKIFYKGIGEDKAKKQALDQVTDCEDCGMIFPRSTKICPECGVEKESKPPLEFEEVLSEEVLTPIRSIPPPNGEILYRYTISQVQNINFAFKILVNRIIDMFTMYRVTKDAYVRSENSGELERKIRKMIQNCYFVLIKKEDIIPENWQGRTIDTLIERVKVKLKQKYNIE